MKRYFLFTFMLTFSSLFMFGQSSDEQAVRQVLKDIITANKTTDLKTFDRIYSSDFVFINATGIKYNKASRLAYLKATPAPESFTFKDEQIRIYGNTAVVNLEADIKPKGQDMQANLVTIVFLKKGGHWQEVNGQATFKSK